MRDELKIDIAEEFPHLSRAPIVEAALEIRARAEAEWEEPSILERLKARLHDYPIVLQQRGFRHEIQIGIDQASQASSRDLGLKGFRFQSNDNLQIAQFNRDGFSFARLQPYLSWEQFSGESFRFWELYSELARPSQIHRLGLRFINRITLPPDQGNLGDYLIVPPQTPAELSFPFVSFLHHDTFAVPDYPYLVNLTQTVQPQPLVGGESAGLIFDIDVFSGEPFLMEGSILKQRMDEMRWLKNKFFFGSITAETLETFK